MLVAVAIISTTIEWYTYSDGDILKFDGENVDLALCTIEYAGGSKHILSFWTFYDF